MMYIIALSVIAGVLGLYYFFSKDSNYFKKHGIPFKPPIPLLGNILPLLARRQAFPILIQEIYNVCPEAKYVGIFEMTTPTIMIRDPELINSIALKNFDIFVDRRIMFDENHDPFFKNLFFLRGDKWRQVRGLLSPAFTSSKMKNMFKLMSEYGTDFASYLAQLPPEQRIMETKDIFARYTTDMIATCAFGVSVDSMRNPENEFFVYGKEVTSFTSILLIKMFILGKLPWLGRLIDLKIVNRKISDFFRNLIETTIKLRDEKGIVRPDILQTMMETRNKEDKRQLSVDDMVAHAFVFFVGGFSISALLCFAAHEIAVNQNIHEKLQKEIDQVLEETNGQISYEAINGMEYLNAVVKETFRKYPISTLTDRICLKDFELPPTLPGTKPFTIKKGECILIPIYGLHYDAKYFEEPEKFDPERFLGERKRHSLNCGAYFPFGLGPRMCIGNRFALLETKVLLFHLLARCDLKTCEKTLIPLKFSKSNPNMQAEDGVWLKILPRKNVHHTPEAELVNEIKI